MCEDAGRGNEIEIKSINNSKFVEEADRTVVKGKYGIKRGTNLGTYLKAD